jgi:hypothetical protein
MDSRVANSLGSNAAHASEIGATQNSIDRNEFFAGLFFLGCANGVAARAIAAVHGVGWLNAVIGTFDVSAIVLAACASGLWLMMWHRGQSVTPIDRIIGVVTLALITLPLGAPDSLYIFCCLRTQIRRFDAALSSCWQRLYRCFGALCFLSFSQIIYRN